MALLSISGIFPRILFEVELSILAVSLFLSDVSFVAFSIVGKFISVLFSLSVLTTLVCSSVKSCKTFEIALLLEELILLLLLPVVFNAIFTLLPLPISAAFAFKDVLSIGVSSLKVSVDALMANLVIFVAISPKDSFEVEFPKVGKIMPEFSSLSVMTALPEFSLVEFWVPTAVPLERVVLSKKLLLPALLAVKVGLLIENSFSSGISPSEPMLAIFVSFLVEFPNPLFIAWTFTFEAKILPLVFTFVSTFSLELLMLDSEPMPSAGVFA